MADNEAKIKEIENEIAMTQARSPSLSLLLIMRHTAVQWVGLNERPGGATGNAEKQGH
jgi:hypothetical protein